MRIFTALMIFCLCLPVSAEVYKQVLPDGLVEYTNVPPSDNAKPLKLPNLTTVPGTRKPATRTGTPGASPPSQTTSYTSLSITNPTNDSNIQSASGQLSVSIAITPALAATDKLTLLLDGQQVGAGGKSTNITLNNIFRGTHTLQATVVNAQGTSLISSQAVTFHLTRQSIVGKPGSKIPAAPQAPKAPTSP